MLQEQIFTIASAVDQALLWVLLAMSVISVAMIIERFISLRKVLTESHRVQGRIQMALQSNSLKDVEDIGKDLHSLEGRALSFGLRHIHERGEKGLEEIFNTFTLIEKPKLEKHLNFLATIGSNAPFIGLLGTVMGIMKAFNDLATATDADQQTVMAGIAFALVATAVGLFVAIPATIGFNYFQRQTKQILVNLESARELCLAYAKNRPTGES